jgi:indole-3-glycerol phosphate synthase
MSGKSDNYNLLTEPWIPVLWADGKFSRVGIKEALTQAGRIRLIAAMLSQKRCG